MAQYIPMGNASNYQEINRKITNREYRKIEDTLEELGIENGYFQELTSANNCFVPDFDLTGMNF